MISGNADRFSPCVRSWVRCRAGLRLKSFTSTRAVDSVARLWHNSRGERERENHPETGLASGWWGRSLNHLQVCMAWRAETHLLLGFWASVGNEAIHTSVNITVQPPAHPFFPDYRFTN